MEKEINITPPILIIDGSAFAFLHGNKENYKVTIESHLKSLMNKFDTNRYIIILEDSKSNFRLQKAITKEYKGNRVKNRENINTYLPYLPQCFEYIKEKHNPIIYYGIENDDAISIIANNSTNCVIIGDDVDLLSIKGTHYKLKKNLLVSVNDDKIFIENDKVVAYGYFNTYFKMIKGSQKENYSGIEGYGEIKTFNELKDLKSEQDVYVKTLSLFYEKYGVKKGKERFEEGWILCHLLKKLNQFVLPKINNYENIY